MVIWVIGLSAAGKTTIAEALFRLMRQRQDNVVFLDGDMVRAVTSNDLGHTVEGRRRNAARIRSLCAELDRQGQHVVCAILSIFPESSEWNRENLSDYQEVYVAASPETLRRRDRKGLYAKADAGLLDNVVGKDIPFAPPAAPDVVVDNDADGVPAEDIARRVLALLGLGRTPYGYTDRSLRETPTKYEYAAFQGPEFLDAYREDRARALAVLEDKLARLSGLPFAPTEGLPAPHPAAEMLDVPAWGQAALAAQLPAGPAGPAGKDGVIRTAGWLMDAFGRPGLPDALEPLLRRFEVSKKIRREYGPDFTKISEPDELVLYALFAGVLARCCGMTPLPRRLVFLNALLKANDILVSEQHRLCTPAEVCGAGAALRRERALMDALDAEVRP